MKNIGIVFFFLCFTAISTYAQQIFNVNASTFSEKIKSEEGIVLDVRTPSEYSRGHIKGSTLISTTDSKFVDKIQLLQKDKTIYVYCLTGSRSRAVANYLYQNGYTKIYNLQSGILGWQQAGYPIEQSALVSASENKAFTASEFTTLIESSNLVLVDFHAPWCAPCQKMAPTISQLQHDYNGKVKVEKVDIEANKDLQTLYNISSIPGLVIFKSGKEVWRHTGALSYESIVSEIKKYL